MRKKQYFVWMSIFIAVLIALVAGALYLGGVAQIILLVILSISPHILFSSYTAIRFAFIGTYRTGWELPLRNNLNPASVAVIIPVRNDPSIFNALPDVLAIDYPNFRICIVDDSDDINFLERLQTLASDKVTVLHRQKGTGRKGGAINYVLDWLKQSSLEPEFVAILDADHHPSPSFLRKAVLVAEETGKPIIAGWQAHEIGDNDVLGKFIRLSWRGTAIDLNARAKLGLAPIFGGSGGLFNFKWLDSVRFDNKSLTEDWKLSLVAYLKEGNQPIVFQPDLQVVAAVPSGVRWYIRQQIRWSEGCFRDFRQNCWQIITSRKISLRTKIGLFYQGMIWAQSILILLSLVLTLGWLVVSGLSGIPIPILITIALLVCYEIGWMVPLFLGTRMEKFGLGQTIGMLLFAHFMLFAMAPIYAYGTLRGLFFNDGPWHVTLKREN